jgi:PAS domain S-box-containing protein
MIRDPFAQSNLSEQESSVLRLAARGHTDKEIAQRMGVSEKTIDTYWSRIRNKLDARNRTHAVAIAFRRALHDQHDPLFGCDEMLKNSEEGVWIMDLHAETVYVNEKAAKMFGYKPEAMAQISGWDLMDEEARATIRKISDGFPKGRQDSFKFRFKRSDGSDLWVLMTITPILDEEGRQIRTLALLNELPNGGVTTSSETLK